MLIPILAFFAGVFLAPVIRPLLRPFFVELVRATLMTADEVRRLSAEMRENLEDAAAEARAEREAKLARDAEMARAATAAAAASSATPPADPASPAESPRPGV
jgi:hypothetical protein